MASNTANRSQSVQCDPTKIRTLRQERAMTQDLLARMSSVERRTVQRAEAGEPVSLETLNFLAAALGVPADRLLTTAAPTAGTDEVIFEDPHGGQVTARRTTSGRKLLDMLKTARLGSLDYEVEPTTDSLPVLRSVVATLQELMPPDPWDEGATHPSTGSLLAELERIVELNQQLVELSELGLALFVAEHVEFAVMPLYDSDEGHLYVRTNQSPELVRIVRVVIGAVTVDRVRVPRERDWRVKVLADDEIPF